MQAYYTFYKKNHGLAQDITNWEQPLQDENSGNTIYPIRGAPESVIIQERRTNIKALKLQDKLNFSKYLVSLPQSEQIIL